MTSKKNTTESNLATQLKKVGTRAVKIVTKAAGGGEWTIDAITQAATWLETGAKEGGLQRAWPQLAAQLRTIVTKAGVGTAAIAIETAKVEAATPDESTPAVEPASVASTRAPRRPRATKPLPPAVEPHTEIVEDMARGGATLRELKRQFLEHLEAIGKSRGTIFSYELDLGVAERHFGADRAVTTITRDQVAVYFASDAIQKNRSGGVKNAITIAKLQRTLRRALVWAAEVGLIAEAPIPPTASEEAKAASATVEARKGTRGRAPNAAFESPIPIAPSAV